MFKVNNRSTKTRCEICANGVFHTYFTPCSNVSIVNIEQGNVDWVGSLWSWFRGSMGRSFKRARFATSSVEFYDIKQTRRQVLKHTT